MCKSSMHNPVTLNLENMLKIYFVLPITQPTWFCVPGRSFFFSLSLELEYFPSLLTLLLL